MGIKKILFVLIFILIFFIGFLSWKNYFKKMFFLSNEYIVFYGKLEIGVDLNGDKKVEWIYIDVILEMINK